MPYKHDVYIGPIGIAVGHRQETVTPSGLTVVRSLGRTSFGLKMYDENPFSSVDPAAPDITHHSFLSVDPTESYAYDDLEKFGTDGASRIIGYVSSYGRIASLDMHIDEIDANPTIHPREIEAIRTFHRYVFRRATDQEWHRDNPDFSVGGFL